MKVIKQGDLRRAAPWWTKIQAKCERCGAVFQLEESDSGSVRTWDDQRDGQGAEVNCPTCSHLVYLYPKYVPTATDYYDR